jgi:hypothetical protein
MHETRPINYGVLGVWRGSWTLSTNGVSFGTKNIVNVTYLNTRCFVNFVSDSCDLRLLDALRECTKRGPATEGLWGVAWFVDLFFSDKPILCSIFEHVFFCNLFRTGVTCDCVTLLANARNAVHQLGDNRCVLTLTHACHCHAYKPLHTLTQPYTALHSLKNPSKNRITN